MSDDLQEILNGEDGAEVTAEQPAETQEATETTGEETTEQVADASPASEKEEVKDNFADVKAGMEAELARIRAKNRDLEEQLKAPAQPEEKVDFFDDPDKALLTMEERVDRKIAKARIDWSEQAARARHEDFDDKIKAFTESANENPALWDQMGKSPDPAEFAYNQASQVLKMREFENIGSFEEKIRADERAKAEEKAKAEYEAKLAELSNLPGSLSDIRASGGNSSQPVINESLEDVLGR